MNKSSIQREILASKLLEIGKSLLKTLQPDGNHAVPGASRDPVKWIQKSLTIAEPLDDAARPHIKELKVSVAHFQNRTGDSSIVVCSAALYTKESRCVFEACMPAIASL